MMQTMQTVQAERQRIPTEPRPVRAVASRETRPPDRTLRQVLALLRADAAALQCGGLKHAAIFGSVARGEDAPASDVDILIELDAERHPTLLTYVGIVRQIRSLTAPLGRRIDFANGRRLRPEVRVSAERDAVSAF